MRGGTAGLFFGLVVLAVVILVVVLVVRALAAAASKRRRAHSPWKIELDDDGYATHVLLTHPDEPPYEIGSGVPINLPHWEYDERLTELRVEAEAKADSRNRRLA